MSCIAQPNLWIVIFPLECGFIFFSALKINLEINAHLEVHFHVIIHSKQCWCWPEKPSAVVTCSVTLKPINLADRLFASISWLVDFCVITIVCYLVVLTDLLTQLSKLD